MLGIISKSTYSNALQNECGMNPNQCSAQGANDGKTAHTEAALSRRSASLQAVFFSATGAILVLTAPRRPITVIPTMGSGGGNGNETKPGLNVAGAF